MVLLIFSPAILLLLKKHPLAGLALSFGIYVVAARTPWLNLPLISASGDQWLFDPFSWQLVFVVGIALGSRGIFTRFNVADRRAILFVLGLALGTIAILKSLAVIGKILLIPSLAALSSLAALPGMDLRTVGQLRLIYFIALLFFLMGIMPSTETMRQIKLARPMIACGQSSLEIFCLGTLLCQLGGLLLYEINGNYIAYLLVIAFGTSVMLVTGMILTKSVSLTPVLRSDHFRRLAARARL